MKIPASIRALYADRSDVFGHLREKVDALIESRLHNRWHYESRVKSEESFTLKIETGRVANVNEMEDFFAATIVVRNSTEIKEAENLALELFNFHSRKPAVDHKTFQAPDQFRFDDLRLNVRWKDDPAQPPTGFAGALFEIQIKTFLQHAWSIATHDLTYKTDDVNWGRMRIAYQIKAMLEHAELSIQEALVLSESTALSKEDHRTTTIKEYIALISAMWAADDLPADRRRLAENIMDLTSFVQINASELKGLLEAATAAGKGTQTRNLTPYGVVVQTLLDSKARAFAEGIERIAGKEAKKRKPVVLTKELELPADVTTDTWKKATILIS